MRVFALFVDVGAGSSTRLAFLNCSIRKIIGFSLFENGSPSWQLSFAGILPLSKGARS
ncbi:MAG: hypothetical protein ACJA1E_001997 [Paracoccaceae bacterium]